MKQQPRFVRCQPEMLDACLRIDREKAGQPVCVYLVYVPAVKRAGLGIRGKRPIGEHIDTIAARNAARIDQLVLLCPVAKPEEAGVIRHHAFRVHPEPVALSDTGDAPGRAAAVHILVDTKLDIFIWQNWDAEKAAQRDLCTFTNPFAVR